MELSSSEDDFVVFNFLTNVKENSVSIQSWEQDEQGEFHLLMQELQNYPSHLQVNFRMSLIQFDKLLAVSPLEQRIKKKTTSFYRSVDSEQPLEVCFR